MIRSSSNSHQATQPPRQVVHFSDSVREVLICERPILSTAESRSPVQRPSLPGKHTHMQQLRQIPDLRLHGLLFPDNVTCGGNVSFYRGSPVSHLFPNQSTSAPTNASAMGVEYRPTATINCFWTIFYKVGSNISIPFVLTFDVESCSCSLTGYGR